MPSNKKRKIIAGHIADSAFKRLPVIGGDLWVYTTKSPARSTRPADQAKTVVVKIGEAMRQPGLPKSAVFANDGVGIYAYSIDPQNPAHLIQEAADGTRQVGRIVAGKFRAA